MILKVFSVFDSKLAVFDAPFYMATEAGAIRAFSDEVNNPQSHKPAWHRHPEDYSLYCLGEFDDSTGNISMDGPPKSLVTASALFNTDGYQVKKFDKSQKVGLNLDS